MAPKVLREGRPTKVVDERSTIRYVSGQEATARFEAWMDGAGEIVRYNMALIDHLLCNVDNGRVLGYDNAHGWHERHRMGRVSVVEFRSFDETLGQFLEEIDEIKASH